MEKFGRKIDAEPDLGEYWALLNAEVTSRDKVRRLRTFALPIYAKRAMLLAHDAEDSTTYGEQCQNYCHQWKVDCYERCTSVELWSHHIKVISGVFGAGVESFFSLLRILFFLNAVLFLVFLIFVILPQGLNSSSAAEEEMLMTLSNKSSLAYTCSNIYKEKLINDSLSSNVATKMLDFLSGTGWMEKTVLFFGAYFPFEATVVTSTRYNYPLAYLVVLGVSFLISIMTLLGFASKNILASEINERSITSTRYCNSVFSGWDYSLKSQESSVVNSNMIYNEVVGNIQYDIYKEEMKNMSDVKKCYLFTVRAVINILILSMLGGTGYLIYFMQYESLAYTAADTNPGSFVRLIMEYLPSLTITVISEILPFIFKRLVRFEKYDSETKIVLTLIRCAFVRLFAIVILVISLYTAVTCTPKNTCFVGTGSCKAINCWETYVGQQFYKLAITQFLVFLVDTFGVESLRALIVKKYRCKLSEIIGLPIFDIPKCVLDLVYVQTITWFGSLFCPMLTGIAALMLFILFYLKLFACHLCYKPSETPFRVSRSNLFFLVILMFTCFLCALPLSYCMVTMTTSKGCGPFREFTSMYQLISATTDAWPSWAATLFNWTDSAIFAVIVFIILLVIIHCNATLAHTRLLVSKHLQELVNSESRNKQGLYRQLVAAGITPTIKSHSRQDWNYQLKFPKRLLSAPKAMRKSSNNGPPLDAYNYDV